MRSVAMLTALGGAALLALTPLPAPGIRLAVTLLAAEDPSGPVNTVLIMGGTGTPLPDAAFVDTLNAAYLQPRFPGYTNLVPLWTPENGLFFGTMSGDESMRQGVDIVHNAITVDHAGEHLMVFGVSQSAAISGIEMQRLADAGWTGDLRFALLGNPTNPAGGMYVRFPGFTPYPPAPVDLFPTESFTGAYDGVADFPRYPLNLVSTANALAGILTVHLGYQGMTADQIAGATHLGTAGLTDFYMIPTRQLPLLWPLYQLGLPGATVADTIDPMLRLVVNLGYGNLDHGLVPDPGGLAAGAAIGFLPKFDPLEVLGAVQSAAAQTVVNPVNDILGALGAAQLPADVTGAMRSLLGYDLTVLVDQWLTSGLAQLAATPGLAFLDPAVLFDGGPLIDGAAVSLGLAGLLGLVGLW